MLDRVMGRNGSNGADKVGLGTTRRPVIGLALGGGAARGFAHIGIVKALVAHGIVPNVVVGTSIGAVVGGAYAAGHLDTLEEWARSLQPRSVFSYLDIRLNGSGLIGGAKLATELEASIGQHPDRGSADQIRNRCDRGSHRPRDLAHPWPHGRCDARLLRAARNFLAGPDRRPLAGRRRAGQSGAGVGGAGLWRRDRDRRQSFQRRVCARHHDLRPRTGRGRGNDAGAGGDGSRPAETRHWQVLLRRTHHEARVLRQRHPAGDFLGHGRCLQHHAGPHHPRPAGRRPAGSVDLAPRRPDRLVRFPSRRRTDRARHAAPPNAPSNRSRKRSAFWRRRTRRPRRSRRRKRARAKTLCFKPS